MPHQRTTPSEAHALFYSPNASADYSPLATNVLGMFDTPTGMHLPHDAREVAESKAAEAALLMLSESTERLDFGVGQDNEFLMCTEEMHGMTFEQPEPQSYAATLLNGGGTYACTLAQI